MQTPAYKLHTPYFSSLLDGARPRSLPAGGYEPIDRPRYTVKRSIFYNRNLVSLCSDHFRASRKEYPIQIYAYKLKISALESSK